MTPEQERNYWILEGYPLMPEWIEFCWKYSTGYQQSDIDAWDSHVRRYYGATYSWYDYIDEALCFVIEDIVTYRYNLGEDHAKQP